MATITKQALGENGPLVSGLGSGCMRMSPVWGTKGKDENESIATIRMALDQGINQCAGGEICPPDGEESGGVQKGLFQDVRHATPAVAAGEAADGGASSYRKEE